jgi:hypothetical protein
VLCQGLLADALSAAACPKTDAKVVVASASLLIPYLSRTTSKIEGQRRESTRNGIHRSAALPTFAAGHGIAPAQPLKVETRVRTPLGLRAQSARSGVYASIDRLVEPRLNTEYPENIPSQIVPSVSSQCHARKGGYTFDAATAAPCRY